MADSCGRRVQLKSAEQRPGNILYGMQDCLVFCQNFQLVPSAQQLFFQPPPVSGQPCTGPLALFRFMKKGLVVPLDSLGLRCSCRRTE